MPLKFNALTGEFNVVNSDTLGSLTPTKGNVVAGTGTAWNALGVGANDTVLTADSAQATGVKWATAASGGWNWPTSNVTSGYVKDFLVLYSDFTSISAISNGNGFFGTTSGSGASVTQNWDINAADAGTHPGYINFQTGTTSGGFAYITERSHSSADIFKLGGGIFVFECSINLYVLADATDDYDIRLGLLENSLTSNNGVYFEYSRANSTSWLGVSESGGTRSTQTGSTATISTWVRFTIVVNAAASSIEFFEDGVSLGTVTTNIPTSNLQPICGIIKTAGTTNRAGLTMDYVAYAQEIAAGR